MIEPNIFRQMREDIRHFGFKQWFLLALNVTLVLASIASLAGLRVVSRTLESTTAAHRFRGESETRFAQLACFLPVGQEKQVTDIYAFRQSLDAKLVEQSLQAPENGSLYVDAYSGSCEVQLSADNGSATATAIGVGGEFFYFHPLRLRSGAYISGDDLMDDLVVLDEELAWRLFGAVDLAGMPLTINGQPFVVSGVVARETDFASKKAYSGEGGLFISYSAMDRLLGSREGTGGAKITCYELVMPDPISGYAKSVVEDTFPMGDGDLVENSSRYSLSHLLEVIGDFGLRSMRTNGVIYPYWENALRFTEDHAALLVVLAVLFAICPVTFALVILVKYIRRGYLAAKEAIPQKVEAAVERHKEARYEKANEKKAEGE